MLQLSFIHARCPTYREFGSCLCNVLQLGEDGLFFFSSVSNFDHLLQFPLTIYKESLWCPLPLHPSLLSWYQLSHISFNLSPKSLLLFSVYLFTIHIWQYFILSLISYSVTPNAWEEKRLFTLPAVMCI